MKNKLLLLLVAVVVFASLAFVACGEVPPAMAFVAPAQTTYYVGDTLNLTGAKVTVYQKDGDVVHNVTTDMLDATTLPNFNTPGKYTVKGAYQDLAFSFEVEVLALPTSYGFVAPAQTTYYVGNTLNLQGGKVVAYGATTNEIPLTTDMLDATTLPSFDTAGTYTVAGTYQGFAFTFEVEVLALPTSTSFVSPAKKTYAMGPRKLNLEGATVTVDGTTVDVTMDMLDQTTLPSFDTAGTYTVKGAYQGYEFSWQVTVYAPYEFKHDADFVYTRAADVSKHVWVRQTNELGEVGDWYNVTNDDFSVFELAQTGLHVEIDMLVDNVSYSYQADFAFNDVAGVSVSEFKQGTVGDSYFVNGILVAIATTSTRNEFVLADKVTGEVISVSDLAVSGATQAMTLVTDLAVGDEITIPVTLTKADDKYTSGSDTWNTSDLGKLYGTYTGGKQLQTAIISRGNKAPISYDNATQITSQDELKAFLNPTNRLANVYTMVHFKGEMGFVWYAKASQLRMYFAEGGVTSYATQKIDDISPVFCEGTQYYTTGKTFRDMVLGSNYSTTTYSTNPGKFLDIYALFIGGNGYYHKFVILDEADAKPMEATVTARTFTAPTVVNYTIGSTLNLTGAKVTTSYDIKADEVVDVTMDMLDASTIPTFTAAGNFTVKGTYQGYEFSFDVAVTDKAVASIAVETAPTKATYTHRQGLKDVDLTGGTLRVNYSDGTHEVVDITTSMLPAEDTAWAIGTVNYTITYFGQTTTLAITYQKTALTISQLLANTPAELNTSTTTYEVTGVVVGPVSSYYGTEILIKEKNSNVVVGIMDKEGGVGGKYNALSLDTATINVGDEIALFVTFETWTDTTAEKCVGGADSRYLVKAKGFDFKNSADLVIISKGNSTTINLTDSDVTVIDSQAALSNFLTSPTRTYKYVKIVGANYARSSSSSANFNLFFGATTADGAKVNGAPGRISTVNADYYLTKAFASTNYMSNVKSTSYSSPASFTCNFYALCIGGNYAAHHFTILQDNWMLTA